LVGTAQDGEAYEKVIGQIKSYPKWAHVEKSVWVVKTDATTVDVRDAIKTHMHARDRLFVAELSGVAAWFNTICKNEWLKANL
jgi:hypothetical protein